MKELNQYKDLPTTTEEDEAMEALAKLGAGVDLKEMFEKMGQDLTANPNAIQYTHGGTLGAPEPQPTSQVNPEAVIDEMLFTIKRSLTLLTSVITSSATKPVEDNLSSNTSLQECVALTLQQADWFKDMIRHELIGGGIEDLAKDAVQDIVESEVESYFENNFDPSYHFDFDDAVHDAVGDRIDDVVSDKIDDALDSYMSNATITITK